MGQVRYCQLLITVLLLLVNSAFAQRFEWRDVVQTVEIKPSGSIVVEDERTLWTTGKFGEAFLCLNLAPDQSITLLEGSGAVSFGPKATALVQPCEDGQGTELVVRQDRRVSERRVLFRYELTGAVEFYGDVVQWYWNILEVDRPPVYSYELSVEIPGGMSEPYGAFVHRFDNSDEATIRFAEDRSRLEVAFDYIPGGEWLEIRYLMDPSLFERRGEGARLKQFLREEADLAEIARNALDEHAKPLQRDQQSQAAYWRTRPDLVELLANAVQTAHDNVAGTFLYIMSEALDLETVECPKSTQVAVEEEGVAAIGCFAAPHSAFPDLLRAWDAEAASVVNAVREAGTVEVVVETDTTFHMVFRAYGFGDDAFSVGVALLPRHPNFQIAVVVVD